MQKAWKLLLCLEILMTAFVCHCCQKDTSDICLDVRVGGWALGLPLNLLLGIEIILICTVVEEGGSRGREKGGITTI
jgi:hypothetical protein